MDRPLFTSGLVSLILLWASTGDAIQPVHDASSFAQIGQMLSTSGQMLGQLQNVSSELSTLNSVLGNPVEGEMMGKLGQANWLASDFGGVLNSLTSPHGDTLSSLNSLGVNHAGMESKSRYIHMKNYAQSKLFHDAPQNPLSFKKHDEIKETRFNTLKSASIDSIALSDQQKGALKSSNEEIKTISRQVKTDRTLQDELRTTNQLLVVIANELTQQRAILAQMLELKAATVAHKMPVVFNTTSLSKANKKTSFQSFKNKF